MGGQVYRQLFNNTVYYIIYIQIRRKYNTKQVTDIVINQLLKNHTEKSACKA